MKIIIDNIELTYNDNRFDYAKDLTSGEILMVEIFQKGLGYTIEKQKSILGTSHDVCKGTYIRIIAHDIYVPKILVIDGKKN